MKRTIEATAQRLSDNIQCKTILAEKYWLNSSISEITQHLFEGYAVKHPPRIAEGDVIVAGNNFGSGVFHANTVNGLKALKVSCIIASSINRIFFRNAINIGLPLVINNQAYDKIESGELIKIDFEKGVISCKKGSLLFPPYPDFMLRFLSAGGLIGYAKKKIGA